MFNRHTRTQEKRTATGDSFELRPQTTAESSTHRVDRHIDDALKAIKLLSATAIDLASYAGVPGLEIALSSLSGLVKMVIKARDNDALVNQIVGQVQAIVRLIEETVNSLMAHIETYQNGGDSTDYKAMPAQLNKAICKLNVDLDCIATDASKLRQSHRLAKIFRSEQNAQLLNKIQFSIGEARSNFQTGCLVRIEFGMSSLQGDMTRIRGELIAGNEMVRKKMRSDDEELLSRLLHIDHAEYRSAINSNKNGYLSGTRTGLLAQLKHWAQDVSDQPPIFILSGAAGTGKSTVAYELAKELDEEGHLGASFFFVRGDAALSSTEHVFPSIAYQLACTQPDFHSLIVEACRSHLARGGLQDMELQLRELIVNPLKTISVPRHPVVVIIDALDECTASASDRIPRMLYVLLKGIRELQTPLRILLTTRPEMHIDKVFASIEFRGTAKPFRMQDIPLVDADNDIRHYFAINLNKFSDVDHLLIARPNLIQSLVERAEGLFIYATTVIRILQNDPRHLLELVDSLLCDPDLQTSETLRLVELDRLYLKALEAAFPSDFLSVRKENRRLVNSVLGTTAILEDQISPTTIKALLGIPINDTRSVLDRIGAVVYSDSDDDDEPIRPLHASFPQFLIDNERCPNPDFFVDPPLHNGQLASACLRLLNRDPHFSRNILRVDEPFTPKEHINDFHDRVHRYIPPYLRYAVKHWATHLHYASKEPELAGLVQSFAESKLLVWLEALSMLNELRSAIFSLDYARAWCQANDEAGTGHLLHDAYRFVLNYFVPLDYCPEQIYISGLALMPPCDLYQRYSQTTTIATLTPRDSRWGACLRVIEGHTYWVRSVGFSSHGRWIVSASDDETVRTWDSRSGNLLNTMESNGRSAGISPDNQRIASGSHDGSIGIWNATSGALISRLYSQSEDMQNVQVRSVAFAPDGRTIIAGIAFVTERRPEPQPPSGTILMWDLIDGKYLRGAQVPAEFEVIHSVAYSLDGASIVTASDDGLVRTWDLMLSVLQTLRGHTAKSYCAAFFPDGTKIASCSADRTTRIWNVGAGACMKVLEGHEGNVTCVAISSPGDRIASGSHDLTVRLWDAHSGECLAVMQDHTDRVYSICISSDGSRLASASEDHTIRVWDLQAATAGFDRMLGHTAGTKIVCCAFSPDGTQLASSDMCGTIVFWDNALLRNADRSHCSDDSGAPDTRCGPQEDAPSNFSRSEMWTPYKSMRWGHSRIDRVAFSPDGTMFAVCNRYSVGIWSIAGFTFLRRIKVGMENIEVVLWLGFSSDSTRIYACFNNAGAKHVTWSCTTGEVVDSLLDSRNSAPMEVQFCEEKGWIIEQATGRKLCWLTDSKRAARISRGRLKAEACHGTYYAAGSAVGRVTVLDLCALVNSEE